MSATLHEFYARAHASGQRSCDDGERLRQPVAIEDGVEADPDLPCPGVARYGEGLALGNAHAATQQFGGNLAALDDRMLKDLGLTRCDVEHEINKRFWQE